MWELGGALGGELGNEGCLVDWAAVGAVFEGGRGENGNMNLGNEGL